jgi:c-di-GMP-binding flagellar brake protein YcgR
LEDLSANQSTKLIEEGMDKKEGAPIGEGEIKPRTGIVNIERRKHPRFSLDLPVEYYRIDSPEGRAGRVVNAGEGGLLVYLPEILEIGQYLRMKLFIAPGHDLQTVEMLVQVVWNDIHLGDYRGDYRTGVKFVDVSPENMDRLKRLLQSLVK